MLDRAANRYEKRKPLVIKHGHRLDVERALGGGLVRGALPVRPYSSGMIEPTPMGIVKAGTPLLDGLAVFDALDRAVALLGADLGEAVCRKPCADRGRY